MSQRKRFLNRGKRDGAIITLQARDDHSADGNDEDGDGAPKRNPKGAGVWGQGSPHLWRVRVRSPPRFFCAQPS